MCVLCVCVCVVCVVCVCVSVSVCVCVSRVSQGAFCRRVLEASSGFSHVTPDRLMMIR